MEFVIMIIVAPEAGAPEERLFRTSADEAKMIVKPFVASPDSEYCQVSG
jgi:hypothetical protein